MPINYSYRLIRSDRRSILVSIAEDYSLSVRIPFQMTDQQAEQFLMVNEKKITALLARERRRRSNLPAYRSEDIPRLTEQAKQILPEKLKKFAALMNVHPSGCRITSARKRFGSCSSKGMICFSCFLMLFPDEAIDYVVVHELAHLTEMNHSQRFYNIIKNTLPDYKRREAILKGSVNLNDL